MLTRLRTVLRPDGMQLLAGHGVADASYRPPYLPYASVVGPLAIETESERDEPNRVVRVRNAGYLAGVARPAVATVPAPGPLGLTVDETAVATVAFDAGPLGGQPFGTGDIGVRVAAGLQAAVRAAVAAGGFVESGVPVTAPARLAELRRITVRWDPAGSRIVIASGRRGPRTDPVDREEISSVAVAPGPVAMALGLTDPAAVVVTGRLTRARDLAPTAVAIDVRVDLWAGSQGTLAYLVDTWTAATPVRAELLLDPTPLRRAVTGGDTTIQLARSVLPHTADTVLAADAGGGFVDRVADRVPMLTGGPLQPGGLDLTGTTAAEYVVAPVPPFPVPWQPRPAGLRGWAVEVLLSMRPGAPDGAGRLVCELLDGLRSMLRLTVRRTGDEWELRGTGRGSDGTALGGTTVTVPVEALIGPPVAVCVAADAAAGVVRVFTADVTTTAAEPASPAPTAATGDADVRLRLGGAAGAGDADAVLAGVVVRGRPVGPADPRLRERGATSVRWPPGTPVYLGRTMDSVTTTGGGFFGHVLAVAGDTLTLDRPVPDDFPLPGTVAHQGGLFFSQRQLRRNDDLMNRIYRVAFEYRVSAFLDDTLATVSAPAVERPEVEVDQLRGPTRATTSVGVGVVLTSRVLTGPDLPADPVVYGSDPALS